MECAVCYETVRTCKLMCGHSFCMSCIKEWYLKSEEEATCPMCRQRLYFKGMHKQEEKWENERHEEKMEEIFSNLFDQLIDEVMCSEGILTEFDLEWLFQSLSDMEYYFNKYSKFNWEYWEDFEDAVNYQYGDEFEKKLRVVIYDELLIKNKSLNKFSKVDSKRILPNIYFTFV